MWLLFAFLSASFAALVAIFGKIGLEKIDSTLATTLRAIIMATIMILISLSLGKFKNFSFSSLDQKAWLMVLLAGVAGALSWLFYFLALRSGSATAVSAIDRLSIVIIVFLAALFLGESLRAQSILGAVLVVIGVILITLK